ncbi:hypothetical protein FRX31_014001 [Thalictrum thalictroides]|uniref:CLAVATA3/ESR (CLE)-related protein n=1 Tax=Thalictrum thalictroides TaxID=46969 RepID=A0A7J6WG96_THATH|nr:hypothetical protein FRX31_014001 [Thalictrum thalictroides]
MRGRILKTLFVTLIFVGILIGRILPCEGIKETSPETRRLKYLEVTEQVKLGVLPDLDPNFVSYRRVPHGSDPIHNRKAGDSRRPPGHA